MENITAPSSSCISRFFVAALTAAVGAWATAAHGQILGGMLPPSVDDPGRPFSYFWHPTDVIGTLYSPAASEITPEGYIYTGFGELMFFIGNPLVPVDQRIKTLRDEHLPCVEYWLVRDGVRYEFSAFAGEGGSAIDGLPVNFERVTATNQTTIVRTAFVSSGYRFSKHNDTLERTEYRFSPVSALLPTKYTAGQVAYNANWQYSFAEDALVRDGRILYFFPKQPALWQRSLALNDNGIRKLRFFTGEVETRPTPMRHDPHSVMGVATYRITLQPRQSERLTFKMPLVPLPAESTAAAAVRAADADQIYGATMSAWKRLVVDASPFEFPEPKVQNTMLANTIFNLLAIDRVGENYILSVNKFQYHGFYTSDSNMSAASLDDMGLHEIARRVILFNLNCQAANGFYDMPRINKDGSWSNRPGRLEGFGHVLTAFERHFALTADLGFLQAVYPSVRRAMAWAEQATAADPLGLLPVATVADDALLKAAHQTGTDIWALMGMRSAVRLAVASGDKAMEKKFEAMESRLRAAFDKQLLLQTEKTGGYIPPSLDRTLSGADWDNLHTLWPVPLFEPGDPRVDATIRTTRKKYAEGILPYPLQRGVDEKDGQVIYDVKSKMHYFHSTDNAMNQLVRGNPGDQQAVVEDLYAMLLHTSSTNATQEFGAVPWSTRDYCLLEDIMPDGTTSAAIIELLRNMLVREYKDELHLFSAVSPEWLKPGRTVRIKNAATEFGPITAAVCITEKGLEVDVANQFRRNPERLLVHLPWFFEATDANVDGARVELHGPTLEIPPDARHLAIAGHVRPTNGALSYERAVQDYLREYGRRYERFLATGEIN
jgi:hypothetical protein